jgi:hypothetical protein
MKRIPILLMLAATLLLFVHDDLTARGPGGGGRVGGGARPATGGGRSPALSGGARPATGNVGANRPNIGTGGAARPGIADAGISRPNPGVGAATRPSIGTGSRPSAGQLNNFLDVPRASTGAVGVGNIGGGAAADFLNGGGARPSTLPAGNNRPGQLPAGPVAGRPGVGAGIGAGVGAGVGSGVGNVADRRQNFADNRPSRIENREQLQGDRQQRRDEIRDQVRDNYPRLAFWSDHPNWAAWRINRPYRWATWAALTGWFGRGAGYSETTYAYGDNIYYSNDQVYYGDQPVATAEQYADQAAALAASAPQELNPQTSDWMPLGVFAVTQDREATGVAPTLFMQLAVNKDGVISGTFKNEATGDVQTLEGMIDKKSQRVAWCVEGKSWPIIETGLSNLTQDTAPVLVHFDDGQTQQWLLVRLPDPKQS